MSIVLQVGVKILLKNSEGKFLLLKRSAEKYPDVENPWDIPGGRIETGSTLLENLARELKEETGLELPKEITLIAAQDILKEARHVVRLTYLGNNDPDPILSDEHSEFGWFTLDELKQLEKLDRYVKELIPKL